MEKSSRGGSGRQSPRSSPLFTSPFPPDVAFAWNWGGGNGAAPLLPGERELLGEHAAEKRLREFAGGRAGARAALGALMGNQAGERQEPLLRAAGRAPRWPEGVAGSITHTAGLAAAAAAWRKSYLGIGLDLERPARPSPRLVRRICLPEEQEWLESMPRERRGELFTLIFSAKESIFKALNPTTGIFLGFADAVVDPLPQEPAEEGELGWRLLKPCPPRLPVGYRGEGRFIRRGGLLLTAVWVGRNGGESGMVEGEPNE